MDNQIKKKRSREDSKKTVCTHTDFNLATIRNRAQSRVVKGDKKKDEVI